MNRRVLISSLAAVVAVAGMPALSSCSVASQPEATLQLAPSPSDFVWIVMHTQSMGSAAVTITTTISTAAGTRKWTGKGLAALGNGIGIVDWTGPSSYRELLNDLADFVQTQAPRWTRREWSSPTQTARSLDVLRQLGTATEVKRDGSTVSMRIPMTESELRALGLSSPEIAALGDSWEGTYEDVTVHLLPTEIIDRVERRYVNEGLVIDSTATLSDFSQQFDVSSPDSSLLD